MRKFYPFITIGIFSWCCLAGLVVAGAAEPSSSRAVPDLTGELKRALEELSLVQKEVGDEKIAVMEKLHRMEDSLLTVRKEYEGVKRRLDARTLDMNNLRTEIKSREQEKSYLSSLLGEYNRNFETRLHIAELDRYNDVIQNSRLAQDNSGLKSAEIFAKQVALVDASLERLRDQIGGAVFTGKASGKNGLVTDGTFVLVGPVAYFSSSNGAVIGVAEQKLGSLVPAVEGFSEPEFTEAVKKLVSERKGSMPFDGSLGNARKMEETKETLVEHICKGGAVMWPLLGLAGLVFLVALYKWVAISMVPVPSEKDLEGILSAITAGTQSVASENASKVKGPVGAMICAGLAHFEDPKELAEERMFEVLLDTRFRLQKALPFIAVGAACAPLMGLLGTVTGIISTFKLITVFGSGDIKMLSAGISEALITTEFGLYIAIPSILSHSFLSRKAKAVTDKMEQIAIAVLSGMERQRLERARARE